MLAVVSHDAGGAEVVSSYVRRHGLQPLFVLEGPARAVFERKLGPVNGVSLDEALRTCTSLLCGTSWQSELEFNALRLARQLDKHSVSFLDHWVNYRDRFVRAGQTCRPDEVWVCDAVAQEVAERELAGVPVRLVGNPYLEDIRAEYAALGSRRPAAPGELSVLYVCEPIREHALRRYGNARFFGYTEEEALRFFLANLAALSDPVERIRIRPHPSEPAAKYGWVAQQSDLLIEVGGSRPLLEDLAHSDVVVGCESMAMVVGLVVGKRVISCIPPGGRACGLPQPEIEHLQQLLSSTKAAS
jgi:hypothetical protein